MIMSVNVVISTKNWVFWAKTVETSKDACRRPNLKPQSFAGKLIDKILSQNVKVFILGGELPTNHKWVITPVTNGISRVNPLITEVKLTHLLSGMSHQLANYIGNQVANDVILRKIGDCCWVSPQFSWVNRVRFRSSICVGYIHVFVVTPIVRIHICFC